MAAQAAAAPGDPAPDWRALDPGAPDPMIYTHAAFIVSPPGGGRNRVQRVRVLNGCEPGMTNQFSAPVTRRDNLDFQGAATP